MFQSFKSMRLVSAVVRRQLMPSTAGLISSSAARFSTEISNVSSTNDIPLTIENMDEHEEDEDENVVDQLDEFGRAYGTGRRKTSVARVWVKPGTGVCTVNGKSFLDYFQLDQRTYALSPFLESNTSCLFDVMCTVKSGGISGQAGAVRLGISRALIKLQPELRPALRRSGCLTRDNRMVEPKKPGQKKARKKYQWVKR